MHGMGSPQVDVLFGAEGGNECKVPRAVETGPRATKLRGQEDNRNIFTMRPVHERRLGGGVRPKPHLVSHGSSHRTGIFGAIFSWTKTTKRRRTDACEKLIHMKNDVRNKSLSWFGALRRATAAPTMHDMVWRREVVRQCGLGNGRGRGGWGTGGGEEGGCQMVRVGESGTPHSSTPFLPADRLSLRPVAVDVDAAVDVGGRPQLNTCVLPLPRKIKSAAMFDLIDQLTWNMNSVWLAFGSLAKGASTGLSVFASEEVIRVLTRGQPRW